MATAYAASDLHTCSTADGQQSVRRSICCPLLVTRIDYTVHAGQARNTAAAQGPKAVLALAAADPSLASGALAAAYGYTKPSSIFRHVFDSSHSLHAAARITAGCPRAGCRHGGFTCIAAAASLREHLPNLSLLQTGAANEYATYSKP